MSFLCRLISVLCLFASLASSGAFAHCNGRAFLPGQVERNQRLTKFRVGTFNVEKLGKPGDLHGPAKIAEVAAHIKSHNLEMVALQEIGSEKALYDLAEALGGEYEMHFSEGVTKRNIHFGFLARKGLPFYVDTQTHRNEVFPRGMQVIIVKYGKSGLSAVPVLIVFNVHYKSKVVRVNEPDHEFQRQEQIHQTLNLMSQLRNGSGTKIPAIITGDFNSDLNEVQGIFETLWSRGLRNAFDTLPEPVAIDLRTTHTYKAPESTKVIHQQIDGIVVDPLIADQMSAAYVATGTNRASTGHYLSDHTMVVSEFNLAAILPPLPPGPGQQ